jgi:hypothetical protein
MMPKKLKQEPRADELEKPYEARPLADDPKKRFVAQCAQKRGRAPGFLMSEEHRGKIKNSSILNALIEYFQGKREMSATQVSVGLGLLKKVLPDLPPLRASGPDAWVRPAPGQSPKSEFSDTKKNPRTLLQRDQ